ncbi:nucleotidyltransferase domain-containing protein [Patescibacteria group bacterium]|nr:nucleotidyltransferase domain-containing protein [Patescibacteria group bacterium]MBU1124024.1 nucleotidyltransferase domain-containing protein [Patescibacteria group bacterium]
MKRADALKTAGRFKKALNEAGVPFHSVIVFGSVARNTMHEQSDIDIAVIGIPYKGDRMDEQFALSRIRRGVSYKIQPIWFYPEHLENKYSTLAMEIKKDGIEI